MKENKIPPADITTVKGPLRASPFYGTDGMHPVPILGEIHFEEAVPAAVALLADCLQYPIQLLSSRHLA